MEHVIEMHNSEFECGVCSDFRMNLREVHRNAMERQWTKAVNIKRPSMNRKADTTCPGRSDGGIVSTTVNQNVYELKCCLVENNMLMILF